MDRRHELDVQLSFHQPRTIDGWDRLCRWLADIVDEVQASSKALADPTGYHDPETADQPAGKDRSSPSSR